jgi:hypothetical protein
LPSQNPIIIPPNARLDADICSEFGTPLFAWHPLSGKISAVGGGIANNLGPIRARTVSITNTWTLLKGAAYNTSAVNHSSIIDFGIIPAFQLTGPWSMFCMARSDSGTSGTYGGNFDGTNNKGIGIDINAFRLVIRCSGGSANRYIGAANVPLNLIHSIMASVNPGVAWDGVYLNGVKSLTNTGDATPAVPVYTGTNNWTLGNRPTVSAGLSGGLWSFFLWKRLQPKRLAEMLDLDNSLMWWWPGKSKVVISLPSVAAFHSRYYYENVGGRGLANV